MNDWLARLTMGLLSVRAADSQLAELATLLQISIADTIAIPTNPRLSYRTFSVRKRNGGNRRIAAPSNQLKQLQRRLLHGYLAEHPVHEAATAFRPGSSIAMHARRHLGQAIVLTADVSDFFPTTAASRVRCWFRELGWRGESLEILTRLCVYRGGLPQGAPTSPALSNLVNLRLDEELSGLAGRHRARYSRYCDDFAFSWSTDREPPGFRLQVEEKLDRYGYKPQPSKGWQLQHRDQRPEITGIVLAGRRLRLPERILSRFRALRSRWWVRDEKHRQQLAGYRGLQEMLK